MRFDLTQPDLVLFDPGDLGPAPQGRSARHLDAWFAACKLVVLELPVDCYEFDLRVSRGIVESSPHTTYLHVTTGEVAIGPVDALTGGTATRTKVAPGLYAVHVDGSSWGDAGKVQVRLERLRADGEGLPRSGCVPLREAHRVRGAGPTVSVFAQQSGLSEGGTFPIDEAFPLFARLLQNLGTDERLSVPARTGGLVGWVQVTVATRPDAFGLPTEATLGRRFHGTEPANRWIGTDQGLLLRFAWDGTRATNLDVALVSPAPGEELAELQERLQRALGPATPDTTATPAPLTPPPASTGPEVEQVWKKDCLDLLLPKGDAAPPTLTVTLMNDDGATLGVVSASPLYPQGDRWLYQIWLLGPRAGATSARVQLG